MQTKIQIKSIFGQVLFELEKENNTVKNTLEEAVKNGANLTGASLYRASLDGASLSWISHDLLAEILRRAAKNDIDKLKIAGLLLVARQWCWEDFLKLNDPLKKWALTELARWIKEDTPESVKAILRPYVKKT